MKIEVDEHYYVEGLKGVVEYNGFLYAKVRDNWYMAKEEPAEIHVEKFEDLGLEEVYIFGKYRLLAKVVDPELIRNLEKAYEQELLGNYEEAREWLDFEGG